MKLMPGANHSNRKKAGVKEIDILHKLSHSDPEDKKHLIRLERYFEHKGHLCMVFENLRYDELTYIKVWCSLCLASTSEKY